MGFPAGAGLALSALTALALLVIERRTSLRWPGRPSGSCSAPATRPVRRPATPNAGYSTSSSTSYWRQSTGHNCTELRRLPTREERAAQHPPASLTGNAYNWGPSFPTQTNNSPAVGAVAWWNTSFSSTGHVAYVEKVISPSEILVSEDNWGGDFRWRRVTLAGGRWPTGFIHLKDQGASAATTSRAWQVAGPSRVMDTKTGLGAPLARIGAGKARDLPGRRTRWAARDGCREGDAQHQRHLAHDERLPHRARLGHHAAGVAHQPPSWQPGPTPRRCSVGSGRTARCASTPPRRRTSPSTSSVGRLPAATCPAGHRCVCSTPGRAWVPRRPSSLRVARLSLTVAGRAGVPTSGAGAVILDVSSSGAASGGWLTTYPAGVTRPAAPQVRFETARDATGLVVAKVGTGGVVKVHTSASTNVMVDVLGWLPTTADHVAVTPARLLDSQTGLGYPTGRVAARSGTGRPGTRPGRCPRRPGSRQ